MWWRASVSTTSTPRVCGKHATMFGQGSYFARKAIYSHNFSKRSPRGVHYMFLAKVLTGKFTVGNPSMRRPPPLNPRDACSDLFDSCVTTGWTHRSLSSSAMIRVILTSSFSMKRWAIQWLFEDHCTSGFLHKRPVRTFGQF